MENKTERRKRLPQTKGRWIKTVKDRNGEKREDFGSDEVTQLPDHVIADRRCQNAAEEERSMHVRQRREDEEGEAEGQKRTKEGGRKERSV